MTRWEYRRLAATHGAQIATLSRAIGSAVPRARYSSSLQGDPAADPVDQINNLRAGILG